MLKVKTNATISAPKSYTSLSNTFFIAGDNKGKSLKLISPRRQTETPVKMREL